MHESPPYITTLNSDFKYLYENATAFQNLDSNEITIHISRFRKILAPNLYNQFEKSILIPNLTVMIKTILLYTETSDAALRVTAYSTLGAMLITLAPYSPLIFISAFGYAIRDLPVSSKISIAIINMFVYLTKFVSHERIEMFMCKIPVLHHFSADISEFIKYFPLIIPLMKHFPLSLLQNILRTLTCVCGKNPSSQFAISVSTLVSYNKESLLPLLIDFLVSNKLNLAVVWLGPFLLDDDEIYNLLGEKGREIFLNCAIEQLDQLNLPVRNLSTFEQSCKICAIFLSHFRSSPTYSQEAYDIILKRINTAIFGDGTSDKTYPPVFLLRLFLLPTPFEKLQDSDKDDPSYRAGRIGAMANYLHENALTISQINEIGHMFYQLRNTSNDLYCTVIEQFTRCLDVFFSKEMISTMPIMNSKTIDNSDQSEILLMLKYLIEHVNQNWVQDQAVSKLIQQLSTLDINILSVFPDYDKIITKRLISFVDSSNDRLHESAIEAASFYASYSNLDLLLNELIRTDWLQEELVARRFPLLTVLAKNFHHPIFAYFVSPAFECLEIYDSIQITSAIYGFLACPSVPILPIDHSVLGYEDIEAKDCNPLIAKENFIRIKDLAFRFICYHIEAYSQTTLSPFITKVFVPVPSPFFLDNLDTDIVSNPTLDHKSCLIHVFNAFSFLKRLPKTFLEYPQTFITCAFALVPIYGSIGLDSALLFKDTSPSTPAAISLVAKDTIEKTIEDEVAASCFKIFISILSPSQRKEFSVFDQALNFLFTKNTTDPHLLSLIYDIVCLEISELNDPDNIRQKVSSKILDIMKSMNKSDGILLLFQILLRHPDFPLTSQIPNSLTLGLLGLENWNQIYNDKISDFFSTQYLDDFPLSNSLLNKRILDLMPKISIKDFNSLNQQHLKFIIDHQDHFDIPALLEFRKERPSRFLKIDMSSIEQNYIAPIPLTIDHEQLKSVPKEASNTPYVEEGRIIKSSAILSAFFRFSTISFSSDYYFNCIREIINLYPTQKRALNALISALLYGLKNKIYITPDTILSSSMFFDEQVLPFTLFHIRIQFKSISSIPQPLLEKLLNLGLKHINESSQSEENYQMETEKLAFLSPKLFFKSFLFNIENKEDIKAHKLFFITKTMTTLPLDDSYVLLIDYFKNQINNFQTNYMDLCPKKKAAFIQLFDSFLLSLCNSKIDQNIIEEFCSFTIQQWQNLRRIVNYDGVEKEFSHILTIISSQASTLPSFLFDFISSLYEVNKNSNTITSFYSVFLIYIKEFRKANIPFPHVQTIKTMLVGRPSLAAYALKALCNSFGSIDALNYVKSFAPIVRDNLSVYAQNFKCIDFLAAFSNRLLRTAPNAKIIPPNFIAEIFIQVIRYTEKASFGYAMNLIPLLCMHPEISDSCFEYIPQLLSKPLDVIILSSIVDTTMKLWETEQSLIQQKKDSAKEDLNTFIKEHPEMPFKTIDQIVNNLDEKLKKEKEQIIDLLVKRMIENPDKKTRLFIEQFITPDNFIEIFSKIEKSTVVFFEVFPLCKKILDFDNKIILDTSNFKYKSRSCAVDALLSSNYKQSIIYSMLESDSC